MKRKDLVALVWGNNPCCTTVVEIDTVSEKEVNDPEDGPWKWPKLEIDLEKGTWKHGKKREKIGYHFNGVCEIWTTYRYGLIGIYDRTNLKHLSRMVWDSNEAVSGR
jgi:hypothetical protein